MYWTLFRVISHLKLSPGNILNNSALLPCWHSSIQQTFNQLKCLPVLLQLNCQKKWYNYTKQCYWKFVDNFHFKCHKFFFSHPLSVLVLTHQRSHSKLLSFCSSIAHTFGFSQVEVLIIGNLQIWSIFLEHDEIIVTLLFFSIWLFLYLYFILIRALNMTVPFFGLSCIL